MSTDATVTVIVTETTAATAAAAIKARWAAEATSDPVTVTAAGTAAAATAVSASALLERLQNRQIALKAELELCLQCEQVQEQNARYEQQIATCWSRLRE